MNETSPRQDQTWTLGALLNWTARFLAEKQVEFPRLDAEVLLAHVVGCKRIDLYGLRHGEEAGEDVKRQYRELIRKRLEGCPVAYLVGRKEFYSLELKVTPAVLIPRPDTEHLVVQALASAKGYAAPRILDLGTGSGNIVIALARHLPTAAITTVDLSPEALAVAASNAASHAVAERIRFLQGDLFSPLAADERFDLIVSNPPYIPAADIASLQPGVRDYEPHLALDGGPDGFAVFDRIVQKAGQFLAPGGVLIVEIGSPQEPHARAKIEAERGFKLAPTIFDSARHPRVLLAQWQPDLP